ncbi:hypothetical protein GGC65_001286 [Sphingopyxis sp. OAS728]|uniref:hypothetical protein n=1 Tax=Sphingopyxis sp. OAS728 TaxID=2663823 RepID=UPI00178B9BDE|nr:hypothetical protein [Sphingopyxis sp. OAS728]MBE1526830.1 hypothetical protein [Sphingopyxis sp. OAS728]
MITVLSLAVYFGVPAVIAAFVRVNAEARLHRERRQEDLDELQRLEMLDWLNREQIENEERLDKP